ncbi:MAG: UDP-N-acetylmuramate--L-alanine ligase [Pseudomonadota bacterium]
MKQMPMDIGPIHLIGIGGIGMSGIAEILANLGYTVRGSDASENANVLRLRQLGVEIFNGHNADQVAGAAVVVTSTAIKADNVEVAAARSAQIPIVPRAEMLAELMRLKWNIAVAGTHGKTTTTSLVASVLDGAGLDATVINGGIINAYGTNARLGAGDWMVVEADESDGTFTRLPATFAIVTNIDPEHLDFWGDFDAVREAFRQFIERIPFYGFAALCIDHPEVQALIAKVNDRRVVSYGLGKQADIRGLNLRTGAGGITFDVAIAPRGERDAETVTDLFLPMFGEHNVLNALAAIAVGREMGISAETLRTALARFEGVKRRFTKTGEVDGITIIDDYGHHPVEIRAVLKAARTAVASTKGRVIAVVQPHRYTRLTDLFEEFCTAFNDADLVIVADTYAAGEQPIKGGEKEDLADGILAHGHRAADVLPSPEALPSMIDRLADAGDFVVCLGAGTITSWAANLPGDLAALRQPVEVAR